MVWCVALDVITYGGVSFTAENLLSNCGALVFVIDAQDDPYTDSLEFLIATIQRAHEVNPKLSFDVFIHKVDGDLFLGDDLKLRTLLCCSWVAPPHHASVSQIAKTSLKHRSPRIWRKQASQMRRCRST